MRILQIASEYPPQQIFGLGRYVCDLSRELVAQGHEVHVLTNSIGVKDQDINDHGVQVHRVDFPPPPKPPGGIAPVLAFNLHLQKRAHILNRKKLGNPEVIVSHDWLTVLASNRISQRWNVPHVWTVHDLVDGKCSGKIDTAGDKTIFDHEYWGAEIADIILANSHAIQDELQQIYKAEGTKIEILHCGIAPERFISSQSESRIKAFRTHFAEPDELLITYVGRLDLEKGIDTLITAFGALHNEIPNSRLAIVGKGCLQQTIEGHINKLNLNKAVTLYGYLRNEVLKHFYFISDIHVCPSRYEPFGLVAIEAMAAGAPVVASATGGLLDIIGDPSVGCLFPAKDANSLANILINLARDFKLRQELGKNGRQHIQKTFQWDIITERAAKHYSKAISKYEKC